MNNMSVEMIIDLTVVLGDMIATTNLHEFNFKRMEWTVQPSSSNKKICKPRTFQSTVLYGDTIIIYGGKVNCQW